MDSETDRRVARAMLLGSACHFHTRPTNRRTLLQVILHLTRRYRRPSHRRNLGGNLLQAAGHSTAGSHRPYGLRTLHFLVSLRPKIRVCHGASVVSTPASY
jgi:hypothetical protein